MQLIATHGPRKVDRHSGALSHFDGSYWAFGILGAPFRTLWRNSAIIGKVGAISGSFSVFWGRFGRHSGGVYNPVVNPVDPVVVVWNPRRLRLGKNLPQRH